MSPSNWMLPQGLSADDAPTTEVPIIQIPKPDNTISELVNRSPEEVATVLRGMLTPR